MNIIKRQQAASALLRVELDTLFIVLRRKHEPIISSPRYAGIY